MHGSSSRLPSYIPPAKDLLSRVPSLSALHPDRSHPAHASLLGDLDLKRDSIRVFSFAQGGILVCPDEVNNSSQSREEQEEDSANATGYLMVVCTHNKLVPLVSIKLVAKQILTFPRDRGPPASEEDVVFCREASLKDVWLEKGQNTFEFRLTIPHDSPVHQSDLYSCSLRYSMVGTVVGGIKGIFGAKNLEVRERVWVLAGPAPTTDLENLGLNIHVEGLTPDLGPCSLDATSSRFLVAGPILISLSLPSPPPNLRIWAIKAYLDQKATITSPRDPSKTAVISSKGPLIEEGWAGPYSARSLSKLLEEGRATEEMLFDSSGFAEGGWAFEKAARVPTDQQIRSSTHPNTRSCIRSSAELVVDLYFTSSEQPTQVRVVSILHQPVFLASCFCLPDRFSLPDYSQSAEAFVPITVNIPCFCHVPTDALLEAEMQLAVCDRSACRSFSTPGASSIQPGRKVGEAY